MKNKLKISLYVFSLILFILGFYILSKVSLLACVSIFIILWANNIANDTKNKKEDL